MSVVSPLIDLRNCDALCYLGDKNRIFDDVRPAPTLLACFFFTECSV
jgi:hypothetical protein